MISNLKLNYIKKNGPIINLTKQNNNQQNNNQQNNNQQNNNQQNNNQQNNNQQKYKNYNINKLLSHNITNTKLLLNNSDKYNDTHLLNDINTDYMIQINIITSFYITNIFNTNSEYRNNELKEALKKNIENPIIEKIHLFIDDQNAADYIIKLNCDKINIIEIGKKPLYSDLFKYAIDNLQNKICMITNSDIYIHECQQNLINLLYIKSQYVYALTRHEYDFSKPLIDKYNGSHDCFIFRSPIDKNILNNITHVQHHWGAENKVMIELTKINKIILNPCIQIKIIHLHKSELREPDRKHILVTGFKNIYPCIIK
jgi:hypothetical protein